MVGDGVVRREWPLQIWSCASVHGTKNDPAPPPLRQQAFFIGHHGDRSKSSLENIGNAVLVPMGWHVPVDRVVLR